jgi:hypothetical protein
MYPKQLKIIYHGDFIRCKRAEGNSRRMLAKLYESLGVNKGKVQQGWRPATPISTGEVVQLHIGIGFDTINIYAEDHVQVTDVRVAEKIFRECPCNCNMSIGVVLSRVLSGTVGTIYENVGSKEAPFYIYSVEVCQNKKGYVIYDNIIGSDFTPWQVGQQVIVMAYHDFLFGCCLADPQSMQENFAQFNATGCLGIIDKDYVRDIDHPELGMTMENYGWRTTFRILPMCSMPLQLWDVT